MASTPKLQRGASAHERFVATRAEDTMNPFGGLLVFLFCAAHLAPLYAPFAYVRNEEQFREGWRAFSLPAVVLERAAYRSSGPVVLGRLERAPALVRFAAATCFVFGSMFVPGLAWALFGLVAAGAGLLGIPGLVIAAWLWSAGGGLLAGTREGAVSAARAARLSLWFNLLLVAANVAVLVLADDGGIVGLSLFSASYACLSIAQAVLVTIAARVVAGHHGEDATVAVDAVAPFFLRPILARRPALAT